MIAFYPTKEELSPEAQAFYRRVIQILNREEIPFLVGGAYALAEYTAIVRHTKDFDLFTRPADARRILAAMADEGYPTEETFSHWLGKAHHGDEFIDVIYSSGNGIAKVDDRWFEHAVSAIFLGEPVLLCPAEEIIWSKAFICERERYDGADINHLIRARGPRLDWHRLLERFGPHWRVLFSHLVLYGFVYPMERDQVPAWVMEELTGRLQRETRETPLLQSVCQGTLLSRTQYVTDLQQWGYHDARLDLPSDMTSAQVEAWTEAGLQQQKKAE